MEKPENPDNGDQYVDKMGRIKEWKQVEEEWDTISYAFKDGEKESLMNILDFYMVFLDELPDVYTKKSEDIDDQLIEGSKDVAKHFLAKFSDE